MHLFGKCFFQFNDAGLVTYKYILSESSSVFLLDRMTTISGDFVVNRIWTKIDSLCLLELVTYKYDAKKMCELI